jgi:hypothetical protein
MIKSTFEGEVDGQLSEAVRRNVFLAIAHAVTTSILRLLPVPKGLKVLGNTLINAIISAGAAG